MSRRRYQRFGACLSPPRHGQEAYVRIHAYHNTHYVPVHNENPLVRQDTLSRYMHAYHNTHSVPVHNISVDAKPLVALHTSSAYRGDVQQLRGAQHQLAGVADRSTYRSMVRRAMIHYADAYGWCAGAHHHLRPHRCMTTNQRFVFGVPAHTTPFVHAGAWTVTNTLFSSALHTEDTYIDLHGAKYRSDEICARATQYNHKFRAGAQIRGRRDLLHSDAYGCY